METEEFYTNEQDRLISLQRSFSETCDVVVGRPETVHSDIRVYPNPGTDFVSVGVEKDPSTVVRVLDVNGRLYLQTQQVADIDISFLPKGVYLVNIRQKGGQITQMLVKD